MTSVNDHHDASREQYISHKLYLERRAGNRYYNLGYAYYKELLAVTGTLTMADHHHYFKHAYKNFEIALLFNKNDVDAKARKIEICTYWENNSSFSLDTLNVSVILTAAKKEYRECKC